MFDPVLKKREMVFLYLRNLSQTNTNNIIREEDGGFKHCKQELGYNQQE